MYTDATLHSLAEVLCQYFLRVLYVDESED